MKRTTVCLLALLSQVAAVSLANAKEAKKESFSKDRLWYVAGLPLYVATVGIFVHEGSHAMAAFLDDDFELVSFMPYPHKPEGRGWVGGSVGVRCETLDEAHYECADKIGLGVIGSAPYITDSVFFVTADLLLSTGAVDPDSRAGLTLYLAGMVSSWYDFARNLIWVVDGSDPDQIAQNFGIPVWSVAAAASAVSAVGFWRLWVNGRRVFFDGNTPAQEANLFIVPMGNSETIGASVLLRF